MIRRPRDVVREQVKYREENLKKMSLFIEGKISDHLCKYECEDGLFKIFVPMADHKDFPFIWEDGEDNNAGLKRLLESSITSAGYKIEKLEPAGTKGAPAIEIELAFDMTDDELMELDEIAQKERAEFHRVHTMRNS